MRTSAIRVVGVLALGGALFASTSCGVLDAVAGGKKKTACKNIESELRSMTSRMSTTTPSLSNPGAGASANAQVFSDTASKVRSEGQNAGGDVASAATAFAGDLDSTARMMRSLSSGNLSGARPNTAQLQRHANDLGRACGFTGSSIRLG